MEGAWCVPRPRPEALEHREGVGRGHGAGTGWPCEPLDKSVAACKGRQLACLQQAESLDLINA